MELYESVLVLLGGATVLVGAVAWLVRSLAGQLLAKDLKAHE